MISIINVLSEIISKHGEVVDGYLQEFLTKSEFLWQLVEK